MAAPYFLFKQFAVAQEHCAMKVSSDAVLFGASFPVSQEWRTGLDIGCGTGLLSLMLAQRCPKIRIDALELDKAAAKQAAENVQHSRFRDRIEIIATDARTWQPHRSYDVVICNPPFYTNSLPATQKEKSMAWHDQFLNLNNVANLIKRSLHPAGIATVLVPEEAMDKLSVAMKAIGLHLHQMIRLTDEPAQTTVRIVTIWHYMPQNTYLNIPTCIFSLKRTGKEAKELLHPFHLFL